MNQSPIFLFGPHKSGTSLLRSLLNGHNDLFTIPIESHIFMLLGYWIDNEYRKQKPENVQSGEILERFCNFIKENNQLDNPFGGSNATGFFNENKFKQSMENIQDAFDDKKTIELYFESIHQSLNDSELGDLRVVEKSVENAEFALELNKYFPNAKFVHIIRNPYANLVSMRKFKMTGNQYPILRRILKTLYNSYYFLEKNKRLIENYHVLKYEDLVSSPEATMNQICDFLEIDFEPILLSPTKSGKIWTGNSMSGEKFNKISKSRIGSWKEEISSMEVSYINNLFPFVIENYAYEKFEMNGAFWKPEKGEDLKRYFANRFYKFYLK